MKKEALQYNPNVEVIPSPTDMERYAQKSYDSKGNGLVLGWIGDHGSIHYLEKMRPAFDGLAAKYPDVRLKIVCDTFFQCDRMKVIEKQWSSEDEISDLQSFDIGLIPLMDDTWSWGKYGLKILQYQGVGVAVVCTPVGINRDLVKDGENSLRKVYEMNPEVAWYLIVMEIKGILSAPFVNAVFGWDSMATLPRAVGVDKDSDMHHSFKGLRWK